MTAEEYMGLPFNTDILIKYSYKDKCFNEVLEGYYVVRKQHEGLDYYGKYVLTEANGEQYAEWNIEDVVDWAYCSELDSFFEERKQRREDGGIVKGLLDAHKYAMNMANETHKKHLEGIKEKIELQKYSRCFDDDDMSVYRQGLDDALERFISAFAKDWSEEEINNALQTLGEAKEGWKQEEIEL